MNNTTEEILKRIDLTLKSGKNEIRLRKKELDSNPDKQSVIHWLEGLGIISIDLPTPINGWDIGISPCSGWPDHRVIDKKSFFEDKAKEYQEALDKKEWQILVKIDAIKFRNLYRSSKLSWHDNKLYFGEEEIKLREDKRPYRLIQTLLKDRNKLWNFDEIADDWGDDYEKDSWETYYQTSYSVNEKVAKETGIKAFLIITCKTVQINLLYLEK